MPKILFGLLGLTLVVGGLIAVLARLNVVSVNKDLQNKVVNSIQSDYVSTSGAANNYGATEIPADPPLTKREMLNIMEASMSAINNRIDNLARQQTNQPVVYTSTAPTASITPTYSGPKTIYIPVSYGGSSITINDFEDISGQEITIDTNNYSGYRQAVLEVSARIFQGNGTGQIRLKNKTAGTAILNSTVSTTSQDYNELTSQGFSLASGKNTYIIQAKSSTGYSVDLQLARIRIDY